MPLNNTNMKRELDHLARFFHMAVDYAKEIGFTGQFLIEPKPKEPTKHQYDSMRRPASTFFVPMICSTNSKLNHRDQPRDTTGHTMMHELEYAGCKCTWIDRREHWRSAAGLGHRSVPDRLLPHHPIMLVLLKYGLAQAESFRRQGSSRKLRTIDLFYATSAAWMPLPVALKCGRHSSRPRPR